MDENIIQTDSYDFEERIAVPAALVYFYEHLNYACRGFEQIISEISERYSDRISVLAVDIEQSPDIAYRFGVESTPFVILFSDGEPAADIEGANLPDVYFDMIDTYI